MSYRLMCDDPERAEKNRERVAQKLNIWAYLQVEAWLRDNPVRDLPYWMYSEGFVNDKSKAKRRGGLKGGPARAKKLTPKQRTNIASNAANKRWHA